MKRKLTPAQATRSEDLTQALLYRGKSTRWPAASLVGVFCNWLVLTKQDHRFTRWIGR